MTKARKIAIAGAGVAAGYGAIRLSKVRKDARRARLPKGKKFIVLGAGFGGTSAARELAKLLPDDDMGSITLIDERGFLLFTPMLTEVAAGEVDARHVVAPPERLSRRISFEHGTVEDIDLASRRVTVTLGSRKRTHEADHLLIALGSVANFHGTPGVQEHACTIKTVQEAVAIRNRVLELLQLASVEPDEKTRRELLTFVVAGGGYTGVETMAAINGLARHGTRDFPGIRSEEIKTVIAESGPRLMTETTPELASFAHRQLERRGVEVLLNTKIARASQDAVELEGGRHIPCRTLIWAGGVEPNPLVKALNCGHGKHGAVSVDPTCAVPGHPGVWAIGDCAEIPQGSGGKHYSPTGQNAAREGPHVARNIVRTLVGERPEPFRYKPIGEMALVGRHAGVGRIYGFEFSGVPAWFLWRAVYLLQMPDPNQQFRIGLDWLLDLLLGRNLAVIPC